MTFELYPHQHKAVDQLHNGAILYGEPGSGKSLVSIAYFYSKVCGGTYHDMGSMTTPMDLYIITTAKKRDSGDWEKEAAQFALSTDRDSSARGIKVTVDSWNNVGNYEKVENAFFIFDEQRVVGSGSWSNKFIKIAKHNKWILLSGTPGDTWLDYIPVFVANGFYKNRTEFKRRHVVYNNYGNFPKVDHYVDVGVLVRHRNNTLVHMPFKRHTHRNLITVPVDHDVEAFEKVVKHRWNVYEKKPIKDAAELFSVMRKVVNSDSSRLEAIRSLMREHPRLIVFYNFDYELEMLRTLQDECWSLALEFPKTSTSTSTGLPTQNQSRPVLLNESQSSIVDMHSESRVSSSTEPTQESPSSSRSQPLSKVPDDLIDSSEVRMRELKNIEQFSKPSTFAVAEWNGHKHEEIPETDRWVYLVQYVAGAEGWNCTSTDAMVFNSLTYSYKNFEQAQGRIDRLNTPFSELWYYVLLSDSMIDKAVAKSLRSKQNFNESHFASNV